MSIFLKLMEIGNYGQISPKRGESGRSYVYLLTRNDFIHRDLFALLFHSGRKLTFEIAVIRVHPARWFPGPSPLRKTNSITEMVFPLDTPDIGEHLSPISRKSAT